MPTLGYKINHSWLLVFLTSLSLNVFSETPKTYSEQEKFNLANESLRRAESFEFPIYVDMRNLLMMEKFEELESLLKELEVKIKQDILYEIVMTRTWWNFHHMAEFKHESHGIYLETFDRWVDKRESYIAYAARGYYLAGMAKRVRSGKVASKVSDEQFSSMKKINRKAMHDLEKSLQMNPDLLALYEKIIHVSMYTGDKKKINQMLEMGLERFPYSYYIRAMFLRTISPRWRGSHKLMSQYIESWQEMGEHNPRIWQLRSEPIGDSAWFIYLDKDYETAIKIYTQALSFGVDLFWLPLRAACYFKNGEYKKALADVQEFAKYDTDHFIIPALIRQINENINAPVGAEKGTGYFSALREYKQSGRR